MAGTPDRGLSAPDRPWDPAAAWPVITSKTAVLAVILFVVLAGAFRIHALDYGGFSEDEVNKVNAVRAYARGEWSANAEHPMMMKVAMWASSASAEGWNDLASGGGWPTISAEAALRFPNALAGAATVLVLFLLVRSFFGEGTALWASLLLALDVSATGINRIGKEDTFLVLFLLLGAWLYEEARARHLRAGTAPHQWYAASGAAFGLMLASKYMPYYLGLWALFGIAAAAEARTAAGREALGGGEPPATGAPRAAGVRQRASAWFYLAAGAAFVAANPAILLPDTWSYLLGYVGGKTITHHGAYFAGRLYNNMMGGTPWGLPWHFYLTYLATKTPLPVLAAVLVGLGELVRRRRERGAVFARVFLLFFLLPASLMASKFARYLLPSLVVIDVVAALGVVRAFELIAGARRHVVRSLAAGALAAAIVGVPLVAQVAWSPYPSLHLNWIGLHLSAPGAMFPNDELYDVGVRESVRWIAQHADTGASVASDAPAVVGEYLRVYGRPDIEARSLSMAGPAAPPRQAWLLAQNAHACFESRQVVDQVGRRQRPDFVYRVRGTTAVETFRLPW